MQAQLGDLHRLMEEPLPAPSAILYSLDPYPGYLEGPDRPSASFLSELRTVTDGWVYITWFKPIDRWMLRQICKDGVHRDLTILEIGGRYVPPDSRVFFWLGQKRYRNDDPVKRLNKNLEKRQKGKDGAREELRGELQEGRPYVMKQPKSFSIASTLKKKAPRKPVDGPDVMRPGEEWGNIGPRLVKDK